MKLYLKHGKKLSTIDSIYLKDFHTPSVGCVEIDHIVEPAIWFKSLIIDSIFIDCDIRNVYWREHPHEIENHQEDTSDFDTDSTRIIPRMNRAVYDEGDCEDFELFDAVIKLLDAIERKTKRENERAQEILRILHLYVLPEIVLKTLDVTLLQDALETVESKINRISADIQSKDRGISLTENSLRKQRDRLFSTENFESEAYLNTCNVDFLGELLRDLERDIDSLNYDLEARQSEVDRLREAVTDEGQHNLQKARERRDEIFTSLEKYQKIREAIKNVTVRMHLKKRKKARQDAFHEIYLELKDRLLKEKLIVKNCCDQKLKMISVREAIGQACGELSQKGETYGYETSLEGQGTSTDVLETNNNKPLKWQTVEDKVKSIIHDGNSGPSIAFRSFCDSITTKIEAMLKENELFQQSLGSEETRVKDLAGDSDEFVNISYMESIDVENQQSDQLECSDRISSGFRPYTNTIKEDVLKHIEEQSKWLIDTMQRDTNGDKSNLVNNEFPHKVWVCYESQLYNQIMPNLSQLYYISYNEVAVKLKDFVSQKTTIELGIDEPWLNDEPPTMPKQKFHANGTIVVKNSSLKSGLSVTLGRMTLDELYESANKGCEGLPDFIDCPFNDDEDSEVFDFEVNKRERNSMASLDENEEQSARSSVTLEPLTIAEVMAPACTELEQCSQMTSVVEKLKSMTRAYRSINRRVCKLKSRYRRDSVESMVCCDEILSASIVLLTMMKKEDFIRLYSNLNLMIDLMPSFLIGSLHDCSLTNFYSAFQYLSDQQVSINRVSR